MNINGFPLWLLVSFLLIAGGEVLAAEGAETPPQPAIAMHGAPKYPADFTHFSYADPAAPQGGTLRLGVAGTFDSLNPFLVRGQPPYGLGTGTFGLVYESLMARSWDEPFTLYGLLAESVTVPEDRSWIIFTLNPRAHWSDGAPVSADDVLFSFNTLRDNGRPNHRAYYKKVATAEKLDALRVKFTFKANESGAVDREMPLIMGLMPVLPQHDWAGRDFNKTTQRLPLGSGPYKVASLEPGRTITYERDANYWGREVPAQRGLHNFAQVRVDYFRDDGVALQAFKAGLFDWRREPDPNKWATAYATPALDEGRLALRRFAHHVTQPMRGFILNTRRPLLRDPVLREAMGYAFDSGWINRMLFHGAYRRTESFFPNSELAATGLPEGKELALLQPYRDRLPSALFTQSVAPPSTDGTEASFRANLLKAAALLRDAGYTVRDGALFAPRESAQPVAFEILLNNPAEEKVALAWTRGLRQLGIAAQTRTIDSAQYQARLTAFDYDITIGGWFNSLSPGNEQMMFWSAAAATQAGSRNYAGIQDPAIDALAAAIPAAASREELVAATRALDRALLAGHYVVPFFHLDADPIAFWPARVTPPAVTPLYGPVLESWWATKAP